MLANIVNPRFNIMGSSYNIHPFASYTFTLTTIISYFNYLSTLTFAIVFCSSSSWFVWACAIQPKEWFAIIQLEV